MSYLKDREIWLSNVPTGNPPAGYFWKFIQNGKVVVRDSSGNNQIMVATSGSQAITGSLTVTEGITGTVSSASYVEYSDVANKPALVSGSAQIAAFGYATTGSNGFNGNQSITGSLTVTGQVVAQTLNVQQVTSSIVFSSGSNIFGNSLANTQQFTGSLQVSGSTHYITGNTGIGTTNAVANLTVKENETTKAIVLYGRTTDNLARIDFYRADETTFAGRIQLDNGTNSNVSVRAQGNLRLQAGGSTDRLLIDTTGNVGIGTTSPSAKLHIGESGAAAQLWLQRTDGYNPVKLIGGTLADGNGFKITMNSTDAFAISSTGNVGIGTTSPGTILHLQNSSGPTLRMVRTSNRFDISADNDFMEINARDASTYMLFKTADTERMRISSTGIATFLGTTVAANGSVNIESADPAIRFRYTGGTTNARIYEWRAVAAGGVNDIMQLRLWNDAQSSATTLFTVSPTGAGIFSSTVTATRGFFSSNAASDSTTGLLANATTNDSSTYAAIFGSLNAGYRMVVRADGNVGIGTTSPSSLLDVQGPSGASGSTLFTIQKAGGFGSTEFFQYYNSSSDYGINIGVGVSNATNGRAGIIIRSDTSGNGTLVFNTTATERMRITSGGNVGIGTTSPLFRTDSRDSLIVSNTQPASSFASNTGAFYIRGEIRYDMGPTINYYPSLWRQQLENISAFSGTSDLVYATSANGGAYTEQMRISGGGRYLRMASGTGGIQFGGDSSSSNALNDYEEGTWTPAFQSASNNVSANYSYREGTYTKIGNMVYAFFDMSAVSISGTRTSARITGLPFVVSNSLAGYSVNLFRDATSIEAGPDNTELKGFAERGQSFLVLQLSDLGVSGFGTNATAATWKSTGGRITGYIIYSV